jgi:hypothetical protein
MFGGNAAHGGPVPAPPSAAPTVTL